MSVPSKAFKDNFDHIKFSKKRSIRKAKSEARNEPAFNIRTDSMPPHLDGKYDMQTGQRFPDSKRAYEKYVEKTGWYIS